MQVVSGDVVSVRTGLMAHYKADLEPFNDRQPGLSLFCARSLHDRDGVYEFMFAAPPLNFPRAVGSPVNPLAVK